jgi:hypothetical protein
MCGHDHERQETEEEACGEPVPPEPWPAWWKSCSWVPLAGDDHMDDHPCGAMKEAAKET